MSIEDEKIPRIREHRLTSIIDQLRYTRSKRFYDAIEENGETGGEGDTASQPLTPLTPVSGSLKSRARRRGATPAIAECLTTKMNGDFQQHNNNNNSVKNERLSPTSHSATPDNSSRSRSVTPSSSSIPGTPPGIEHTMGRNYSDFMRSLAAKYNNSNPNEYFNSPVRNGLVDPRFSSSFKPGTPYSGLLSPLSSSSAINNSSPKESEQNTKKASDIFPGGIPVFPPMIDMSSTQALLALVRQAKEDDLKMKSAQRVNNPEISSPLDLSSAGGVTVAKRSRLSKSVKRGSSESPGPPPSSSTSVTSVSKQPCGQSTSKVCLGQCIDSEITSWSVDDVVNFVSTIDICAEYAENFREQRIDGSGLPLLTEEHLTTTMNMKLGPALKLKSLLSKKLGSCALCLHCSHCHNNSGFDQNSSGSMVSPKHEKRPASNS